MKIKITVLSAVLVLLVLLAEMWRLPKNTDVGNDSVSGAQDMMDEDIYGRENVFTLPSVCAKAGETFVLPLRLCGKVSLCAFDLRIYYDTNLLRYAGCNGDDEDLLVNCDAKSGTVYVNFLRTANINSGLDICDLFFQVLTSERHESTLALEVVEAVAVDAVGDIVRCDSLSVDSILYLNMEA